MKDKRKTKADIMSEVRELRQRVTELEAREADFNSRESKLLASEARYRALFEHMKEGVAVYQAVREGEDFLVASYNRAAEQSDGVNREEIIGKSILEIFPPGGEFRLLDVLQRVWSTGEPESHSLKKYDADKLEEWRDTYVYRLPSAEIVAIFSDETESKRAEEELHQRTHDLKERAKELHCLFGISNLLETPKISLDQIVQGIVDLIRPAWQYPDITCVRVIIEGQEYMTDNFRETMWKQESDVWAHGRQIGILEVYYLQEKQEDAEGPFLSEERKLINAIAERLGRILERKRAEEALRTSEERFRAVFEGAQDCIFVKDQDLRYTHVNPAMEELFGLASSQMVGRRATDLLREEDGARSMEVDLRILDGKTVEEEVTREIRGSPLTFHEIRVPLRNAGGQIIGICGISRNVTERKKLVPARAISVGDYPSEAMQATLHRARYAAAAEGIVLLQGESGSGKDYLARWIHDHSRRSNGPFLAVNCAAISQELAESELFGHEAGAFTGARGRKKGLLELAEGGTLLLNEIGELSLSLQSKLLAFLDTRAFFRVGGQESVHVHARLVAATHRDLDVEVREGRFLRPLLYRLDVWSINVPPVRDRIEDIPVLIEEIMSALASELQLPATPEVDPSDIGVLTRYRWPGNVRELRNVLERAIMLWEGGRLDLHLPSRHRPEDGWSYQVQFREGRTLRDVTDEVTRSLCEEVLQVTGGNKKEAAQLLGISRAALYRTMERLGLVSVGETLP